MSGPSPSPPGRRRLPPAERRQQILRAASDLLLEVGIDGLRMDDVARRVGVTKAAVFYHFPSQDELLAEIYRDATADRIRRLRALADAAGTPTDRLRVIIRYTLDPPAPDDPRSPDAVVALLDAAHTRSGALENVRGQRDIEGALYVADLVCRDFGVGQSEAVMLAATFGAGMRGFASVWRLADWSLEGAVDFYLGVFLAAIDHVATSGSTRGL